MVQLSTNPTLRGRVLAIYIVVLMGGQAAGGLLIGWIAETFGTTVGFAVAGGVPVLAALVIAVVLARRHELTIKVNLRSIRRPVRIVKRPRVQAGVASKSAASTSGASTSAPSQRSEQSTDSAP
jgi:MFS family permease